MKKSIYTVFVLFGVLVFFNNSCNDNDNGKSFLEDEEVAISTYLEKDTERFSMWVQILKTADVFNALAAYNPYGNNFTVFAPTNEGVTKFINASSIYNSFEELLADKTFVVALAKYHILNREVSSINFSFGALPDTTASGDYIVISFETNLESDSNAIVVNNTAYIVEPDIEQSNGIIHAINMMMEPNVYSAYEWIAKESRLSIFAKALTETGLVDSMNIFLDQNIGLRNRMTVWVESDEVFNKRGIFSYEDLLERYDNTGNVKDRNNDLKIFMAYHLMKADRYLNDFPYETTGTFDTYAALPIKVTNDFSVKINVGGDDIDTLFQGNDTIPINYVGVIYSKSNVATLNGPIHLINDVLEVEGVGYGDVYFHFRENEPIIEEAYSKNRNSNTYSEEFLDLEDFISMHFKGISSIIYGTRNWNSDTDDWIYLNGDFTMTYTTPKMLPGKYRLIVKFDRDDPYNARVQFYWNGLRLGAPIDASFGQTGNRAPQVNLGEIEVTRYESQTLEIDAVRGGTFIIFNVFMDAAPYDPNID